MTYKMGQLEEGLMYEREFWLLYGQPDDDYSTALAYIVARMPDQRIEGTLCDYYDAMRGTDAGVYLVGDKVIFNGEANGK